MAIELLHITAHMGGGVGKVLSRLVEASTRRNDGIRHVIVCLEQPEKDQFTTHVGGSGIELLICPSAETLRQRVEAADIVQVEWWHHPVVAAWLCSEQLPPMRLIVWSHVSGLSAPELPPKFVLAPHRFLFSSPCSWLHPELAALRPKLGDNADVVFSSGGFDDFPNPPLRRNSNTLTVGYLGSLNFAKLHPNLTAFLRAVRLSDFKMIMIGDPVTAQALHSQTVNAGIQERLVFRGYHMDVAAELAKLDVLAYLLNPLHYGTTENALLEAMAMGVIPIVLNNPAESCIVQSGKTGVIVDTPESFADALDWLDTHPEDRAALAHNAALHVRNHFSIKKTASALDVHYRSVMAQTKRSFDFRPIFGSTPADWFRTCQGSEKWRFRDEPEDEGTLMPDGPHFLYERTKGSVFHYHATFPMDERLTRWAFDLERTRMK